MRHFDDAGWDTAHVSAHKGVVVTASVNARYNMGGDRLVVALDAVFGKQLWNFTPDTPTWNFMPHFTEDDTIIFQDFDSKLIA